MQEHSSYEVFEQPQRLLIFREKAFWLLNLLTVLYFFQPLFGGESFFFRDLSALLFADKQFWLSSLKNGEIPFWNPLLVGGEPYFNNMFMSALYPLNLIFFLLPFIHAFNWFIVLHFLLAASGAYFCARTVGLKPVSSMMTGIVYTFSGGMLSLANLPGLHYDMAYLPFVLAFWHLFLLHRNRRWFLCCVGTGVVQALAWSHEGNEITMLILLGWTCCASYPEKSLLRRILLVGALTACIIGICAIIILPGIEIVRYSGRQYVFSYENFALISLHPQRAFELAFPWFFGTIQTATSYRIHFWGSHVLNTEAPFILNSYFGWGILFFAVSGGLLRGERHEPFSCRTRRYFLLLSLCFLIGSFGRFLPYFPMMYRIFPFVSFLFHSPEKLVVGMAFPVSMLTGYASEWYFQREATATTSALRQRMVIMAWGIAVMLCLLAGGFWGFNGVADWWMRAFFDIPSHEIVKQGLKYSFFVAALMMLLLALLIQYRRVRFHPWQQMLAAIILLMDLWIAGNHINRYVPQDFFTDVPEIIPIIRQEIGDGRLFRDENIENENLFSFQVPTDEFWWLMRWQFETLSNYIGFFYNIPLIFHQDPSGLGQKQITMLRLSKIPHLSWEQKLPLLSASAVTMIITHENLSLQGVERIADIPNISNVRLFLYRNLRAAHRVEFVTEWKTLSSYEKFFSEKALAMLIDPNFDPRKEVILYQEEAASAQTFLQGSVNHSAAALRDAAQIHLRQRSLNAAAYDVSTKESGYLVFAEPFYPGWEATVDGQPAPQLRANLAFTAIPLSAGEHVVTRRYVPKRFYEGAVISLGFIALTLALTRKRFGIVQ